MEPDSLGVLIPIIALSIPIVAIVGAMVKGIVKTVADASLRAVEIRRQGFPQSGGVNEDVVQALRGELAQLRDTSTQYAMSLQHTLERLEQRVEFLERKTSGETVASVEAAPAPWQTVGRV